MVPKMCADGFVSESVSHVRVVGQQILLNASRHDISQFHLLA